jgi:polar amino acid transport system substrate-binding protein
MGVVGGGAAEVQAMSGLRTAVILLGWVCESVQAQPAMPPVRLVTHELPPYSYATPGSAPGGVAVKRVQCAFARIDVPLQIEFLPWARAQSHAREGLADGFFAASQSAERDSWAVMSATIAPQQWRWYLRSGEPLDPHAETFKKQASVASFAGANMQNWLKDNGYRVVASPASNQQLLDMLLGRRLDAILANQLVMESLLAQGNAAGAVHSVLEQDKPLSIYFSKVFLARVDPGFLARLNQAILGCSR